ncbi:uncharacterized protein E0L32_004379 [Thyridium curvatum]|uniref:WLM domain-containing protein n=1 Tax=Thyridium curvatum TaxID=1093900 RepID=A0A507BDB2_9PEZI|nr:uncharacterized protein E0L32_004379 [Thyridium curvatum]TPX15399.1 hypothetical protein E0L32_004379 [Thyridium curvatum]
MPVGIQRLNAKKSQPNPSIVFIKPLKGPDEAIAQDFLERIAAQCLPIMKEHHLSVMTLEEYEPNREFVGRNFNAGEVVQLVLRPLGARHRWLPFEYVQMVMMHELAHCVQMNHSRAFWAVRNRYADEMRTLWARGYTGEGMWGRGALLSTGEFERDTVSVGEGLPEHLCGGTYRSRGRRKRKAKKTLSYQEQKERRILKKFGANGVALGEDEGAKKKLEGRSVASKPRVAGSKRGRELRAAAALARFDQQKKEEEASRQKEEADDDDETASEPETESDYEEDDGPSPGPDALDIDGTKLLDKKGHGMVKVCEDENPNDEDAQQELLELQSSFQPKMESTTPEISRTRPAQSLELKSNEPVRTKPLQAAASTPAQHQPDKEPTTAQPDDPENPPPEAEALKSCAICSFGNDKASLTCAMSVMPGQ